MTSTKGIVYAAAGFCSVALLGCLLMTALIFNDINSLYDEIQAELMDFKVGILGVSKVTRSRLEHWTLKTPPSKTRVGTLSGRKNLGKIKKNIFARLSS